MRAGCFLPRLLRQGQYKSLFSRSLLVVRCFSSSAIPVRKPSMTASTIPEPETTKDDATMHPAKKLKTNGSTTDLWKNVPKSLPEDKKEWLPLFEITLKELVDSSCLILEQKLSYGVSEKVKKDIVDYYRKCFLHSIIGGKMTRGLTVLRVVSAYGKGDDEVAVRRGFIAGALVELLQAFFLVMDDVMDSSITRRGKPCWYRMEGVTSVNAVNDSICLEAIMYALVNHYFSDDKDMRLALYETLHENTFMTILGQHIDTNSIVPGTSIDLSMYTMDRWDAQVMYKTGFYTFFLPAMAGVIVSGQVTFWKQSHVTVYHL